jgi:hypothetical protein
MTVEKFMVIVMVTMILNGGVVVLSFLYFRKRSLQMKILGINFLYQFLVYHSLGVFDLRGMEVNFPVNTQILFPSLPFRRSTMCSFKSGTHLCSRR